MGKSGYFSQIFGHSPVAPLQQHMEKVISCVEELVPYFQLVMDNNWEEARTVQTTIVSRENEADDLKNRLRSNMSSSLFMPVDRRDVLDVLDLQDRIANKAKDISGLMLGRYMHLPEEIHADFITYLHRCIEATRQAQTAINELDELVATGFRGDEVKRVITIIEGLHIIEADTDTIQIRIRATLFGLEKSLNPVDVIFLYQIIKWTGDLANTAQSIGNRIQIMLAN